jgi:hypothetical protein
MTHQGKFLRTQAVLMVITLGAGIQTAAAQDNGPTQTGQICMQKVFGAPVSNSNKLNCTANDIRLSRAVSVSPDTCLAGTTFDLTATFETVVTANARYDAGFFFRIDGGANARGDGVNATGLCSLSALTPALSPALELDGDTAGDLNSGTYLVTFTIPGVLCQDSNKDGFLNLPNCTSWHSNQGTVASIDQPFSLARAFDFDPDTKSKCVCDDNFQVPVIVESGTLTVVKTANPTSVPETGQDVTYSVQVTNEAQFVSITIQTIEDDIYGNLADAANPNVMNNTCPTLVGTVLAPGGSASCSFQANVSGNAGDSVTDIVEVCGPQDPPPPSGTNQVCGSDDATVTVTDVPSTPTLQKDVTSTALASCSLVVNVTYTVGISNPSAVDTLTVNSLNDDTFGNIADPNNGSIATTACVPDGNPATCEVGGTIPPSGSCSCTFVAPTTGGTVSGNTCAYSHANTVTGGVTDDDGASSSPSDGAQVDVSATVTIDTP